MLEHEQGAERVDAEGQQGVVGVDLDERLLRERHAWEDEGWGGVGKTSAHAAAATTEGSSRTRHEFINSVLENTIFKMPEQVLK